MLRGAAVAALAVLAGCGADEAATRDGTPSFAREDRDSGREPSDSGWVARDWEIFHSKVRWAASEGLDTLPVGPAVARLAVSFVGTRYTPGTLEAEGPESLVINFREMDCVTFVENMLALTRFVRGGGAGLLDDPHAARARYEELLTALRYRDGRIDGYPSRLHYFSEWLSDNDRRGQVRAITDTLDPEIDAGPITFMSEHPEAYRQLADPEVLAAIRATEARLNANGGRAYVPEDRIAAIADRIEDGDVIAATSTVEGLDVAHTGIAVRVEGRLHLVHAPLVGRSVEVSERPLADRILAIPSQDGIMVARPTEDPARR